MNDWALQAAIALGILIVLMFVWTRQALVSLNADLRTMLDQQRSMRARLETLEAMNQIGHDDVMATKEKQTWTN